jgi:hypothetical protein
VTYCTTVSCRSEPLSTSQQTLFREIIDGLDRIIDRASNQNSNQSPGSGDNPNLLLLPFQPLEENGGKPFFVNFQFDGGNNFVTPSTNFGPPQCGSTSVYGTKSGLPMMSELSPLSGLKRTWRER